MCQSLGYQPARLQGPVVPVGLSDAGQLHQIHQAPARREDSSGWGRGQYSLHLGPRHSAAQDQGGVDQLSSRLLCPGDQSGLQSLFQLLQVNDECLKRSVSLPSFVSVTGTSPCGTFTTRLWSDSSRDTQTGPAALISLLTAPSFGPEVWTTRSARGTSEREDNSSNMTSAVRYSALVTVPPETGYLSAWRTAMWKFSIPANLKNISSISTKAASCPLNTRTAASGSCPLVRTISSTPGGLRTEPQYSSRRKSPLYLVVTSQQMINTS